MLIVRRVTIHNWRAVEPGTTVQFSAGINLLIGAVATGKSALLELLTMILRSDFSPVEDEPYDVEYQLEYVDLDSACHMTVRRMVGPCAGDRVRADDPADPANKPDNKPDNKPANKPASDGSRLQLDIQLLVDDRRYHCTFADGQIRMEHAGQILASHTLQMEDALEPLSWALIAIAGRGEVELKASIGMVGDLLRGHYRAVLLDPGLDVFRAITGTPSAFCDAASVQLRHPLPLATIARLGSSVPGFASVQLAYQAQVRLKAQPEATTLVVRHDELPMFERLIRILDVEHMQLELTRVSSEPLAEATLYRYGYFRFVFKFKNRDAEIDHHQLSYGQKRLLALMYCLDADADHLIADGLPGGLPLDWLAEILGNLLGDPSASCQVFASYDDPRLLRYLPENHPAHPLTGPRPLQAIACARTEGGKLTWKTIAGAAAERLSEAHQSGPDALAALLGERAAEAT